MNTKKITDCNNCKNEKRAAFPRARHRSLSLKLSLSTLFF